MTLSLAHYYLDPRYHRYHFNDTYAVNSVDVFVLSITFNILLNLFNFVMLLSCCSFHSKKDVGCMMITEFLALLVFEFIILVVILMISQDSNTELYNTFLAVFYSFSSPALPFLYNAGKFVGCNVNGSTPAILIYNIVLYLLSFIGIVLMLSTLQLQVEQSWEDTINYSYILTVNLLFIAL